MDNKPIYEKYTVTRNDGKPLGRTLVIEVDKDPQAYQIVGYLSRIYAESRPNFAKSLEELAKSLENQPGSESE